MVAFDYRAINQSGRVLVGTMEAGSPREVVDHLDRTGYMAISTREARASGSRKTWRELLTPEPKPEDITSFTLDLAMLLKGGVTLNEALAILMSSFPAAKASRRCSPRTRTSFPRSISA